MYIFVRARSDPIEFVQVGLLDLVQYSFVVVAVIALAGRIDLFFQCVVEIRLRDLAFASQRSGRYANVHLARTVRREIAAVDLNTDDNILLRSRRCMSRLTVCVRCIVVALERGSQVIGGKALAVHFVNFPLQQRVYFADRITQLIKRYPFCSHNQNLLFCTPRSLKMLSMSSLVASSRTGSVPVEGTPVSTYSPRSGS